MALLSIRATINAPQLLTELAATVPACAPRMGSNGQMEATVRLERNGDQIRIEYPNGVSEQALRVVIASHQPVPQPRRFAAVVSAVENATTLNDFRLALRQFLDELG